MKRIIKLTERDLTKLIKRIVKEDDGDDLPVTGASSLEECESKANELFEELKSILRDLNRLSDDFSGLYAETYNTLDETDEDSEDYSDLKFLIDTVGFFHNQIDGFLDNMDESHLL
jgi:hypothetical protein